MAARVSFPLLSMLSACPHLSLMPPPLHGGREEKRDGSLRKHLIIVMNVEFSLSTLVGIVYHLQMYPIFYLSANSSRMIFFLLDPPLADMRVVMVLCMESVTIGRYRLQHHHPHHHLSHRLVWKLQ